MNFKFTLHCSLPKLAWLATCNPECSTITVHHGSAVETSSDFFVEGVWGGAFKEGHFAKTDSIFGTGAIIEDNQVCFVTPAHTLDSLFYCETPESLFISNSMAFLLSQLNDRLPADYPHYDRFLDSVVNGINSYEESVAAENHVISRLLYRNLIYDGTNIAFSEKVMPPHFETYEQYFSYISSTYSEIAANIHAVERQERISIFSTQSKGYDTTAINSIAVKHGIDKVFTCDKARDKNSFVTNERSDQPDDDGTEIGKSLGLNCIRIDRLKFRTAFKNELLYFAGHYKLADINLLEINEHVDGITVLLTGVRGEIWYDKERYVGDWASGLDDLKKWDMAGHGMAELRLHLGLILIPMPFIGARRQTEIHKITESEDMKKWRLGQFYDRPIPRRIAEDAGVPREQFGQVKHNTTVSIPLPPIPFNKELRAEYLEYLINNRLISRLERPLFPLIHKVNEWIYYRSPNRFRLIYFAERAIGKVIKRGFRFKLWNRKIIGTNYCFSVNKVADNYKEQLHRDQLERQDAKVS